MWHFHQSLLQDVELSCLFSQCQGKSKGRHESFSNQWIILVLKAKPIIRLTPYSLIFYVPYFKLMNIPWFSSKLLGANLTYLIFQNDFFDLIQIMKKNRPDFSQRTAWPSLRVLGTPMAPMLIKVLKSVRFMLWY